MMGNKDYLSGGCDMVCCADLPGKLCYEKLDKKSEKDYMIMPENPEILIQNWSKRGGPDPPPPPTHTHTNQIWILCQKFTY